MKKAFFFLACIALLSAGCNKVMPEEDPAEDLPRHLTVDIQVSVGSDTRAVKTEWRTGDKVYVVFDAICKLKKACFLTLTYTGTSWIGEFSDPALEAYLLDPANSAGNLGAIYLSDDLRPIFYYFATDEGASPMMHYMSLANKDSFKGFFMRSGWQEPYTVVDGKLTAEINLFPESETVHFFIPGISSEKAGNYTLSCTNLHPFIFDFFYFWYTDPSDLNGPYTENFAGSSGAPVRAWYYDGGGAFFGKVSGTMLDQETEYVITVTDNNGTPDDVSDDVYYTLAKTATLHRRDAIRLPSLSDQGWVKTYAQYRGTLNGHPWVRMADGRRWSTLNAGAESESDPGNYISHSDASQGSTVWGGGWRLPIVQDWDRLLNNSAHVLTPEWSTDGGDPSFLGLRITMANQDPSDPDPLSLFLPAAGYITPENESAGTGLGYYWTDGVTGNNGSFAYCTDLDPAHEPPFILYDVKSADSRLLVRYIIDE